MKIVANEMVNRLIVSSNDSGSFEKLLNVKDFDFRPAFFIPDAYTLKTTIPLKPVVEKMLICKKCQSLLEKQWKLCPYCGRKQK